MLYDQILFVNSFRALKIKAIAGVDNRIFVFLTVEQKLLNFEEFNGVCSFELIN